MLHQDWLMRQVEDLGTCLAAVLSNKAASQYHEARMELESASLRTLGLDVDVLVRLPLAQVIDFWTHSGELDAGRAALAASLLHEDALIQHLLGDDDAAGRRIRRATQLLTAAITAEPSLAGPPFEALRLALGIPAPVVEDPAAT